MVSVAAWPGRLWPDARQQSYRAPGVRFGDADKLPAVFPQLRRMRSREEQAARYTLYQTLRAEHPLSYTPAEETALRKTHIRLRGMAAQFARQTGGLNALMRDLEKQGYVFLFKDDALLPGKDTTAILKAFDYEPDDIREYNREYRDEGQLLTVGELLPQFFKAQACFVEGGPGRKGYLLFSSPREKIAPNQFWHELFHAMQHENGLYKPPLYKDPDGFFKREMEASQFVIEHTRELGLNRQHQLTELRIWSLRFEEYLNARRKTVRFA